MIDPTWRRWAKGAGIDISQYPTAMSAPREVQRAVAAHGFKTEGFKPWEAAKHLVGQEANYGSPARPTPSKAKPEGVPGPAETPTRTANVDQGLLAYAPFKLEEVVREKQQEQVHQQAVNQAQEQLAQAAQQPPMSEPVPLSMTPLTTGQEPDFAALMLPRLRRGLLADQRYAGGLLDGL